MSTFLEISADKILSRAEVQRMLKELERERAAAMLGVGRISFVTDYYMLRITLNTGIRRSEIAELQWRDIHDGFMIIRLGKGKKRRPHPLDKRRAELEQMLKLDLPSRIRKETRKELARVLRVLRATNRRTVYFGQETQGLLNSFKAWKQSRGEPCGPTDHLFIGTRGPLTKWGVHERWSYWKKRLGFPAEIKLHSMRHYNATWLLEQGVSLAMVSRQLGHASAVYTAGYLHHTTEARARLVQLL